MSLPPNDSDSAQQIAAVSLARVRQLFARPVRCAGSQFLRREISGRMFERLSLIKLKPVRLLDAGCGEGEDLLPLQQAFPEAECWGMDASAAMLQAARQARTSSLSGVQKLLASLFGRHLHKSQGARLACADFGHLPLPRASMDMLWSNLALHWHPRPHEVMAEWARVLRVDGLLMFSCLGPDSFSELRAAFAESGAEQRVLPFVDLHDYGDMLVGAGFATPVMDMEKLTLTYSSTASLLADVRSFGGNPLATQAPGLQGKQQWRRFLQALESQRGLDGRLSVSMEVIYGHAFRPQPRVNRQGESIIRFDAKRG